MSKLWDRVTRIEKAMAPNLSFQEQLVFVDFSETEEAAFERRGVNFGDVGNYIVVRWYEKTDLCV